MKIRVFDDMDNIMLEAELIEDNLYHIVSMLCNLIKLRMIEFVAWK